MYWAEFVLSQITRKNIKVGVIDVGLYYLLLVVLFFLIHFPILSQEFQKLFSFDRKADLLFKYLNPTVCLKG